MKQKTESQYKTELVTKLRQQGWYARRIEDQFGVGIPDIMVGIPYGPSVMIEAKRVINNKFGPTPRQMEELRRWAHNGAPYRMSWIMGFKGPYMYLHKATDSVVIQQCECNSLSEFPHEFLARFWQKCLMTDV